MSKIIKVGVIGAGAIAEDHCSGINQHPQARVVAAVDISTERLEVLKKQFSLERTYTDWKDALADKELDAVTIALPNYLHATVALSALHAGKHVLVEKPFAMNYKEALQVVKTAKKTGLVFMVGMNQRFGRHAQIVKALVEKGELGEIYHVKAYYRRRAGAPKFGTWFCRKDMSGGGAMMDIGVHVLDLALYLMDNWEPVTLLASVYTKFGNRKIGEGGWGKSERGKMIFDVDDFGTALLRFKNGATLQLDASWVLHQEAPTRHNVELFGTEAGATLEPPRVFKFAISGKRSITGYEIIEPQNVPVRYPGGSRFKNWIDAILGKDKPVCTPEQALVVQKILDAIYLSSTTGKEVRLK
jgi:predicted dehydrogenase